MALREDRAGIRLLFDENLPWRVAAALQVLEFAVSFVGDDSASPASPRRGSEDEVVLNHASGANQIIVTSNLDMILLCVERHQRVVWLDPRGRQLRRADLVLLVFRNINDWTDRLGNATDPVCLRVMRAKTETLELDEAGRRVRNRMSGLSRKLARARQTQPPEELFPA